MHAQITKDIGQDYYQQNFPNDGQRFVAWYLRNIHLRDPIQARDDITDGADDKQINAIFVHDDSATIFVVQGKFIGKPTIDAEPLREVLAAWIQMRELGPPTRSRKHQTEAKASGSGARLKTNTRSVLN